MDNANLKKHAELTEYFSKPKLLENIKDFGDWLAFLDLEERIGIKIKVTEYSIDSQKEILDCTLLQLPFVVMHQFSSLVDTTYISIVPNLYGEPCLVPSLSEYPRTPKELKK